DQAPGSFAGQTWVPRSPIDVEITFSWGEYYQGRWISPKSTNMRRPLILEGLHEFHPEGLLLTCRTEAPAGVSERLILWMIYYDKGDFKVFQITFTSKNSSPVVADNDLDPSLFTLIVDFYQQFWDRQTESTLDCTSLDVPRKDLTVRVRQPENSWPSTVDETIFTNNLHPPGSHRRPGMHPVENQGEAPLCYAADHSPFLAKPDERVSAYTTATDSAPTPSAPIAVAPPPFVQQVAVPIPIDP